MADIPEPPMAPARPTSLRHGGDVRVDPWFWLRARNDPEVLAYLEAENAYTDAALAHTDALRDRIYAEIVARVRETDASAPIRRGEFEYFVRTIQGQQYEVHCRRPAGTSGVPEPGSQPGRATGEVVVLDENELAHGHDYFAVGDLELDPTQTIAAYTTDTTGGERYRLRFRDVTRGEDLDDAVDDVYYGLAWASDSCSVLYVRPDEAVRPWQVWRHTLGSPASDDVLVFQEDDDRFFVSVSRARTGRYLVVTSASKITSEVWLVDADDATVGPRVVEPASRATSTTSSTMPVRPVTACSCSPTETARRTSPSR